MGASLAWGPESLPHIVADLGSYGVAGITAS